MLLLSLLAHPVRAAIIERLTRGPSSPSEMAVELGTDIGIVDYHTRRLQAARLVRRTRHRHPRRTTGPPPKYYRADPLYISDEEWRTVPMPLRVALTDAALRELASNPHPSSGRAERRPEAVETSADAGLPLVRTELVGLLSTVTRSLWHLVNEANARSVESG